MPMLSKITFCSILVSGFFFSSLTLAQQPPAGAPPPQAPPTMNGAPVPPEIQPPAPAPTTADASKEEKKESKTKIITTNSEEHLKKRKGFKTMYALFDTTLGKIKCKLFYDKAPLTVETFTGLAEGKKEFKDPNTGEKKKGHFYDGLTFHRVIPKFMIQGGDPLGNGTGGPGFQFKDEIYPDLHFDKGGILAMANSGKDTNGSQFFITTDPTPWLDGHHTIFGEVVEGMDVLKKISETPRDMTNDKPLKPVKINKLTIIRK
jgi:peptidyl-prolyl cis-trans isomerase A (cyclophilin A)